MNSTVKVIPTKHVMSGAADFTITVDSETRVEVAGAREHTAPEGPPPPPTVEDAAPVPDMLPEPPTSPTPSPGGDQQGPGESPADGAENS